VRFLWGSTPGRTGRYTFQPTDDLYALGVCLYRAVTGRYPYTEWLPTDVLQYAILHRRPLTPVEINPQIPRALSDLIMRLLAKAPRARYPNGAAVREALVALLRASGPWDRPIFEEAPPRPVPPRPPRTPPAVHAPGPGRWRLGVGAGAALLALMSLTFVWTAPLWRGGGWTNGQLPQAPSPSPAPTPAAHQKRAPCTPKLEVEYSGACWFPHKARPPNCPSQTVAYNGECLLPVPQSRSAIPTSLEESPRSP
jgi:eukaryotic-like serine/threonine-protein kinase